MIGGWAINRYSEPRFTGDIDFYFENCAETELKLRSVLTNFGFGSVLPPQSPLFDKKIIMLGRPPNRIDLLCEISGLTFAEAYSRGEYGMLDGLPVKFICKADLIVNKTASARDKDLLDLRALTRK